MTIPVSTVPAAKAWLFGQLTTNLTAATDATLGVTYGPSGVNNPDDMVWLGDTQRQAVPWTMTGGLTVPQSMQETYDLTVNVNCYRSDAETVEARAWVLVAGIEDTVRTDPTFGGLLIKSYPNAAQAAVAWDEEFKGLLCSVAMTISCLASL